MGRPADWWPIVLLGGIFGQRIVLAVSKDGGEQTFGWLSTSPLLERYFHFLQPISRCYSQWQLLLCHIFSVFATHS
jgi:hypothetical protein